MNIRLFTFRMPRIVKTGMLILLLLSPALIQAQTKTVRVNFNKYSPEGGLWNDFNSDPTVGASLINVQDDEGQATTIGITLQTAWADVQNSGLGTGNDSGVFPDDVIKNYFRVYNDTETVLISGLDPATTYHFRFHSGRASDLNPYTEFEINGTTVIADARYNTSTLVELTDITPNPQGEVTLYVRNTSGSSQGYLNGMEIEWSDGSTPPDAPTNLQAANATSSSLQLTWTDVSTNETGFELERSTTPGSGYTLITTTAADATSFTDTGLQENTTYYYRLRAINAIGPSGYTPEISGTTLQSLPIAPTGLTISAPTYSTLTLSWTDQSGNESGFEIERSTTSGSGFSLVHTTAANVTGYTDTGLPESTPYYYRVRAQNTAGTSAYTTEAQGMTSALDVNGGASEFVWINFNKYSPEASPWNNFNSDPVAGTTLTNLLNNQGQATTISVTLDTDWANAQNSGLETGNDSGVFPDDVIKNYFRTQSDTETVTFSGLDPAKTYHFRFHSGRASDLNPFTEFEINGESVTADARYNTTILVELLDIIPDASGNVTLLVRNGAGSSQAYLNGMEVEAVVPVNDVVPDALEIAALRDLYERTRGDRWTHRTNWPASPTAWDAITSTQQIINWSGVTITGGDVTAIEMTNNTLGDTLPESLGDLAALKNLKVNGNYLLGPVPSSLTSLAVLDTLDLSDNVLSSFPSFQGHPNLANLYVDISTNYIPPADMEANVINEEPIANTFIYTPQRVVNGLVPDEYEFLALRDLHKMKNKPDALVDWPDFSLIDGFVGADVFGSWHGLTVEGGDVVEIRFTFGSERVAGEIPEAIGLLTALRKIYMINGSLTGPIPESIGNLTGLEELWLSSGLSGALPASFGNLQQLWHLSLPDNQIEYNEQLSRLSSLLFFSGDRGNLTTFPYGLLDLEQIEHIWLQGNNITGPMPDFSSVPKLQQLRLGKNNFFGPVSPSVFALDDLTLLRLGDNNFTSLPDSRAYPNAGNMTLYIDRNYIPQSQLDINLGSFGILHYDPQKTLPASEGTVPDIVEIYTLKQLFDATRGTSWSSNTNWPLTEAAWAAITTTDMMSNFHGVILSNGDVVGLSLPDNTLQGNVPALSELKALQTLDLSRNAINGALSTVLSDLTSLEELNLSHGNFLGGLELAWEDLTSLSRVDLSHNNLFGPIPPSLYANETLEVLYLNDNQLSGSLSWEVNNTYAFRDINLSANHLQGDIDALIERSGALWNLNVAHNQFTGLQEGLISGSLQVLNVSDNDFTGPLPASLLNSNTLREFYGANNTFTGDIPTLLAESPSGVAPLLAIPIGLEVLDVTHNRLTGIEATLDEVNTLQIGGNGLEFDDLEGQSFLTNAGIIVDYSPQDSVNTYFDLDALTFSVLVGGTSNTYQWYKNENPVSGATSSTLTVDETEITVNNSFWCAINNTQATKLTLYSRKSYLALPEDIGTGGPASNIFWSIADGGWSDPSIWSHTEGGPVANDYPAAGDVVYILDHQITVDGAATCQSLDLIVDKANTLLTVNGAVLQIYGEIKLTKRAEGFTGNVRIINDGEVQLIEDIR